MPRRSATIEQGAISPDGWGPEHAERTPLVYSGLSEKVRRIGGERSERKPGVAMGRLAECGHQLGSPSNGGSDREGDGFRFRFGRFNQPKSRLMGSRKPGRIGSPSRIPSSGNSSGDRPTR